MYIYKFILTNIYTKGKNNKGHTKRNKLCILPSIEQKMPNLIWWFKISKLTQTAALKKRKKNYRLSYLHSLYVAEVGREQMIHICCRALVLQL